VSWFSIFPQCWNTSSSPSLKSKVKHAQADVKFEPVWPNNEESGSLLKPSSCNSVWCANLMTETHQNSLQWYRQTFTTYSVWDLARSSDLQGLIYRSLSMPQNKKEKWNYNSSPNGLYAQLHYFLNFSQLLVSCVIIGQID